MTSLNVSLSPCDNRSGAGHTMQVLDAEFKLCVTKNDISTTPSNMAIVCTERALYWECTAFDTDIWINFKVGANAEVNNCRVVKAGTTRWWAATEGQVPSVVIA